MLPIFDTHAHYDDEAFEEDREALLTSLPTQDIAKVVNVGASLQSCRQTYELMECYSHVYGAIGIHPNETTELTEEDMLQLREWCRHPKCVAIGEIGLDYYWDEPERGLQQKWFRRQLQLAREEKLPIIVHSRDAAKDTADILQEEHGKDIGGVIHCFSYTKEIARIFLDMGFYIGIGGVITFKNAKKLKEAAEMIPLERIVLETDCPYLAPEPNRGKRNSSLYLPCVVSALAQLKGVSEEEIRRTTWENAHRLYRLPMDGSME